jgi:1-acyl-sn-glycerol-3-phosphate acyltransferase
VVEAIYRLAVIIDAWWISRVLGIQIEITDEADVLGSLSRSQRPVVICNHQSWFDIFLLQTLISSRGPILKFVVKVELLWVPVLGWICLVLNFPRLNRKGDGESRSMDLRQVETAALRLGGEPGGLLIFPEGTRFSPTKRESGQSGYLHLLNPKPGGFAMIRKTMPDDTTILDVSIRYDQGDADIWRCMSGGVRRIRIRVESWPMQDVENVAEWLHTRWSVKDLWLNGCHNVSGDR